MSDELNIAIQNAIKQGADNSINGHNGLLSKIADKLNQNKIEIERLRIALAPFCSPPSYVFDKPTRWVPAEQPEYWIGGGWFSSADFKIAQKAYTKTNPLICRTKADTQ